MSTKKLIGIVITIVVVLVGLMWIFGAYDEQNKDNASEYSAVLMSNGDIYFGRLSFFPEPKVKDAWLLQQVANEQGEPQLNLVPLTSVFWGPTGTIRLNKDQIIFWTRLRNDGSIAEAFKDPELLKQLHSGGNTVPIQ